MSAAWCTALATALSVCCAAPNDDRVAEIVALLETPPAEYLPEAWATLVDEARRWVANAQFVPATARPAFRGMRTIEAALRDKYLPVPAWAERFA